MMCIVRVVLFEFFMERIDLYLWTNHRIVVVSSFGGGCIELVLGCMVLWWNLSHSHCKVNFGDDCGLHILA